MSHKGKVGVSLSALLRHSVLLHANSNLRKTSAEFQSHTGLYALPFSNVISKVNDKATRPHLSQLKNELSSLL